MTIARSGIKGLMIGMALAIATAGNTARAADGESAADVIWMPAMNTFRRYAVEDFEPILHYYSDVLGFERLQSFAVGGASGVMRVRAGATELKFNGAVPGREYEPGGIDNATGLRLWTFFFSDQDALTQRFVDNGYAAPEFEPMGNSGKLSAVVEDPEGQLVQLIITGDAPGTTYDEVEIGLTVSDLEESRAYYRDFVGLEELEPVHDPVFDTMKYSFVNGSTTISLRHFGTDLPADTGTGGIQYVVSDAAYVDRLAKERGVVIDQPLSELRGFSLITVWLDDPDGVTNYFAQTGAAGNAQNQRGSSN